MQRVELRNPKMLVWCRVPQYLTQLPNLIELRLNRGNYQLYGVSSAISIFKQLPPTLETLELEFANAVNLFRQPPPPEASKATDDVVECELVPWNTMFPNLKTLVVFNSWVAKINPDCLPASLLSLNCGIPGGFEGSEYFISRLPRGLTHLTSEDRIWLSPEFLSNLPPSLTDFQVPCDNVFEEAHVAALPRGLLHVGDEVRIDLSPEVCAVMPPQLRNFRLASASSRHIEEAVQALPPTITELNLIDDGLSAADQSYIAMLPPSVLTLAAYLDLGTLQKDALPPNLTSLKVTNDAPLLFNSLDFSRIFPDSLTILDLSSLAEPLDLRFISAFPRSLISLKVYLDSETEPEDLPSPDQILFPPKLEHLTIDYYNYEEYDYPIRRCAFPETLKSLNGLGTTFADLKYLPSNLTSLCIDTLYVGEGFSATDPELIERAMFLRSKASLSDLTSSAPLTQVTIFDLLPRSLRDLAILYCDKIEEFDSKDFAQLPILEKLTFHEVNTVGEFPAECLLHIPMQRMRELILSLGEVHDYQVAALNPRLLTTLKLGPGSSHLTKAAAKFMPPGTETLSEELKVEMDNIELNDLAVVGTLRLPTSEEFHKVTAHSRN